MKIVKAKLEKRFLPDFTVLFLSPDDNLRPVGIYHRIFSETEEILQRTTTTPLKKGYPMRPSIIATIFSLTVFAGAGFAGDHDGKPEGKGDGKPTNEHHRDGDAKLTEEQRAKIRERMEGMKEKHPELFKKIDTDGDGKISPEEMRTAREKLEEFREKDDHKTTDEPIAKMKERIEIIKEKHPELYKRIDKNGDGKISPEEMHAAREMIEQHRKDGTDQHHKEGKEGQEGKEGKDQ